MSYFIYALVALLCLGLFLLRRSFKSSIDKNQSHRVSSLIVEGIKAFNRRAFSSIFQVLIYLSIALFLFTTFSGKTFIWSQVLSSFIAGFVMCIVLFVTAGIVPQFIPSIIDSSKGYLRDVVAKQFDNVAMSSFIIMSVLFLSLLLVYSFFSKLALIGYGLGIIFSSFFIRISGAIFKSSVDIGKSTSSQLEKTLPKKEANNLAVILEISADYIAKLSGFCSDIIGSFVLSFTALVFFAESFRQSNLLNTELIVALERLPFLILTVSVLATIVSYFYATIKIKFLQFSNVLLESLYISILISGSGLYWFTRHLPETSIHSIWTGFSSFDLFSAYIAGLIGAILISFTAEVLSSNKYALSKHLARFSEFGSSIIYLKGVSIGLISNVLYLIYIVAIVVFANSAAGFYGIAMSALGVLSVTPTIIIISSFGPLATSTNRVAQLSTSSQTILTHSSKMETLGQSTIAIGNGFSAGTSILSTLSLFLSAVFLSEVSLDHLFSMNIYWLIAMVSGVMLPFIASGFLLSGLTRIALFIKDEIKRQFEQIPYLLEGKATPDVTRGADATARQCMDALIIPGLLIAILPLFLSYYFDVYALVALALGMLIVAMALNFYWAVSGDVIHNSKQYVRDGHHGGADSRNFRSLQYADNIANALREVLSPSMNIFAKSIMILTLVVILIVN